MNILAVGINHKTSAIGIREKFYLQPTECELLLSELKNDPRVVEAFVLSTCNRTEIYANLVDHTPEILIETIFKVKKMTLSPDLQEHFYTFSGQETILHLLRVTTGVDSLVIGEKQILGQVREALEFSSSQGMMSRTFNILANLVLEAGKKVRRETQIDFGGSSISWAAVMMAQNVFGSLQDKTVLILGSGKMGRLAVQQLGNKGVRQTYMMNRTTEKAEELAHKSGGVAVPFWDIKEILPRVDVCICSASCTHYLMDKDLVEKAMQMRKGQKLVCIDISVPRNIDPQVADVEGVYLFTVDDLDKVVQDNIQKRLGAVRQVEEIIIGKVKEFYTAINKIQWIEKEKTRGGSMKTANLKYLVLAAASIFIFSNAAQANFNMIKAYKDAFPDTHPKCINCHTEDKPKKEEGQHENNDYGKAAKAAIEADAAAAQVAKEPKISEDDLKLLSDKFSKLGSFNDFKKKDGK